ncbi:zinc finger matrin-type protein CG9776 [Condylostylus longicornis]|uniref:zinc finger matrin-type protein CG9776 n=1 Tax=Condylostylus longicornis TaxID=2530218 RepID=UPI00244DFC0A|nr:zinc finger matrin-type protein CG9776 [Condylostylus longicornis]XP_055378226.1 zinc finger matrin-type protein CG9776 [Condylostylus longicornis]XP_055378227.1 zinc finger matrin-type protein CG9776 [Condylostylus longicornis]XP_055378228.1 zinc finger matrin-type protein CG9776 [Condylostylus longicornis]
MSPRRRNRDSSPWSTKRSRSRSYSPGRRYRRSPRNDNRRRSRSRDKYAKRDQSSNNYRSDFIPHKGISSSRVPPPPPPTVHSISTATTYNPVPEPDYKNYGGYNQYNTMQPDYGQSAMTSQFNMSYPPPPSWGAAPTETHAMAAPPPWPVAPPIPAPIHQVQPVQQIQPLKENNFDNAPRDAAVAQEIQNQREELKKQRNDYLRKSDTMKKELKMLKEQMIDLIGSGDAPPSPTTKGYIDENEKLQGQIQKKINTIENVLDMLNGIIGEDDKKDNLTEKQKSESSDSSPSSSSSSSSSESDDDSSPERLKTKVIESMKSRKESQKNEEKKKEKRENNGVSENKFNFVFYDPEMNWCQTCNVFPKSAKDYLNHLHCKEHIDKVQVPPTPWHDDFRSDEFPHIENAQIKRVPIRGLQFFVPSRAWFCKLCKVWMGDLHCASLHLKSRKHSGKYDEFFQKNLTYEVEWMAERQKALDNLNRLISPNTRKISQAENVFDNIPLKLGSLKNSEDKQTKSKKSESKKSKSKKKRSKKHKKGSSSSTSNSSSSESEAGPIAEDRAASIRVAMRNIKNQQEDIKDDLTSKGGYNPMDADETERKKDDLIMTQWNTPQPIISESEKKLLEQLKGKLKNKPHDEPSKKENDSKKFNRDHIRRRSPIAKERSPATRSRQNRSRSRDRYRIRGDRRSRSINRYNRRSRSRDRDRRSRSRDRDRRSRSRRRNGSRGRSPYHWRGARRSISRERRRWSASKSKSRSKSRSSSASRRSSRIEKPSVRYPEFRPRISENESKRRSERERKLAGNVEEEGSERKKSPATSSSSSNKKTTTSTSSYAGGKKLPFIGRMPVLAKKQQEQNNENSNADLGDENMNQMRDPKSMEDGYSQYDNDGVYYDDLMPDPMQYASLMGAPPPPPPPMHAIDDKEILPPGIDEMETDFVPKPISEAPVPRKGPLPKDFEEALNIIFPGENKTDNKMDLPLETNTQINIETPHVDLQDIQENVVIETIIESINDNNRSDDNHDNTIEETIVDNIEIELQQIEMPPPVEISAINNEKTMETQEDTSKKTQNISNNSNSVPQVVTEETVINELSIALPEENIITSENKSIDEKNLYLSPEIKTSSNEKVLSPIPVPNPKQKEWRPEELDDLAMLGIDADDLAAQCI